MPRGQDSDRPDINDVSGQQGNQEPISPPVHSDSVHAALPSYEAAPPPGQIPVSLLESAGLTDAALPSYEAAPPPGQIPVSLLESVGLTDAALPSYEAPPPFDTDILGPTTLLLAGQAIHAQTTDSPPLYRFGRGLSDLKSLTTGVDLMRIERKGKSRLIYELQHIRRTPGGLFPLPSESPAYYLRRANKRGPGPAAIGLKKVRGLLSRKTTHIDALPVDPSGKKSEFGIPTFVKGGEPIFTADGREWTDGTKTTIAVMHEDKEGMVHSLVIKVAMPRGKFEILVALWCCYVWELVVANATANAAPSAAPSAERAYEGAEGAKRKTKQKQSKEFGILFSSAAFF